MKDIAGTVRVGIDVGLDPTATFAVLVEELAAALARQGIRFERGVGGHVVAGAIEVGHVVAWEPSTRIGLEWHPADWQPDQVTHVDVRFEPIDEGTRVTMEHLGWGRLFDDANELAGWFAGEVAAPLFRATASTAFGDWLTDRGARWPSGARARSVYRDPLYHYPSFRFMLTELALTPNDHLLDVGCGGGAFLKDALRSGCRGAGVDHSPEMVEVAREANHEAIAAGRLEILEASADRLPFPDSTFTCAAMHGVLGFIAEPVAALKEIGRVLETGGRLVLIGSDPDLKGTPACPEPMASRLRFYDDDALQRLGHDAGFETVSVVRRNLESIAREVGVPEEHQRLFAGRGSPFLFARKS